MAQIDHQGRTQFLSLSQETLLNEQDLIAPADSIDNPQGDRYIVSGFHSWEDVDLALDNLSASEKLSDSRYPYTYACDFLRESMGPDTSGNVMSRSSASKAISDMAEAIGEDKEVFASKLADKFLDKNLKSSKLKFR